MPYVYALLIPLVVYLIIIGALAKTVLSMHRSTGKSWGRLIGTAIFFLVLASPGLYGVAWFIGYARDPMSYGYALGMPR